MTIGELIRNIRKEKGFTQYYLAEKMYCDRTTISKWENNKNIPRLSEIYLLCKVLNVEPTVFINGYPRKRM